MLRPDLSPLPPSPANGDRAPERAPDLSPARANNIATCRQRAETRLRTYTIGTKIHREYIIAVHRHLRPVRGTTSRVAFSIVYALLLVAVLMWVLQQPHPRASAHQTGQATALPLSLIQNLVDAVSQEAIAQHIQYLQDDPNTPGPDSLGTRYSYSPGLAHAAEYIGQQFAGLGLAVEYDEFLHNGTVMTNVVATLPGIGAGSGGIYIVGAHFDSIGLRTPNWNSQTDPAPGADDNASGTSVVLELARVLSQERFAHTLRFITFSGEEQGLWGSAHYAWEAQLTGQDIQGMINLDMVSWDSDGNRVMEIHAGTGVASIALAEAWEAALVEYDLNLVPQTWTLGATTRSDHASFWARGYPAILLIEDAFGSDSDFNAFYHTTSDTFDKLDMSYSVDFARATVATLADLADPIAPDVGVSKSGPAMVSPGSVFSYTLAYSNTGTETATGVLLTEALPEGLIYLSDDSGLPRSDLGPGIIAWQVGALAPDEGASFNLVVALDVGVQPGTLLTNTVEIGGVEPEAKLVNNIATSAVTAGLVRRIYLPLVSAWK